MPSHHPQAPLKSTHHRAPSTSPTAGPFESPTKKVKMVPKPLIITPTKAVSIEAQPSLTPQAKSVNHFTAASALIDELLGKYNSTKLYHPNKPRAIVSSNQAPRVPHRGKGSINRNPTTTTDSIAPKNRIDRSIDRHKRHIQQEERRRNQESSTQLPPPPIGPPRQKPNIFSSPFDIVSVLRKLLHSAKPLVRPFLDFIVSPEAAEYNFHLLRGHNFNLHKLLNDMSDGTSVTSYGSEFKPPSELSPLLKRHPRWKVLSTLLQEGSSWPIQSIPEPHRIGDLEEALQRGNHQSASKHGSFLADALSNEVVKGWELILPASRAKEIPELVISPMGVAEHVGVQADGTFATKARITHALSFPGAISNE